MDIDLLFNNLTKNEKRILEVFMLKKNLTTTDITRNTGISRPNCYDTINRLMEKGLLTKIIYNNKPTYSASYIDYENIIYEKEEELKLIKNTIENYNKRVNDLEKSNSNNSVEVFLGERGLSQMVRNLPESNLICTFGAEAILEKKYNKIWKSWIIKLKKNKTKVKAIYNDNFRHLRKQQKIFIMEVKFIKRESKLNVTTQIMDNQINIFHWQDIPLVIVIKNKEIAKAYRKEFDLLWEESKE